MTSIILIEPETAGNIGAVARAMKNFGFKDLILIAPKCNHLSKEALDRSTHAKDILKNAKIKDITYLKRFHTLVATTSKLGNDYNIPRSPISPEKLAEKISKTKKKIAIIFGRESNGLTNKEISLCDFIVTIPSLKRYPSLNLSHAVSIILYELSKKLKTEKADTHIIESTKKEKQVILQYLEKILNKLEFSTKEKKQTQKTIWKRIIGKSFLTKREAFAVMGFFRKLLGYV